MYIQGLYTLTMPENEITYKSENIQYVLFKSSL